MTSYGSVSVLLCLISIFWGDCLEAKESDSNRVQSLGREFFNCERERCPGGDISSVFKCVVGRGDESITYLTPHDEEFVSSRMYLVDNEIEDDELCQILNVGNEVMERESPVCEDISSDEEPMELHGKKGTGVGKHLQHKRRFDIYDERKYFHARWGSPRRFRPLWKALRFLRSVLFHRRRHHIFRGEDEDERSSVSPRLLEMICNENLQIECNYEMSVANCYGRDCCAFEPRSTVPSQCNRKYPLKKCVKKLYTMVSRYRG